MYFNVNFNMLVKLIKVLLLVSEFYINQNARCNDFLNSGLELSEYFNMIFTRRLTVGPVAQSV